MIKYSVIIPFHSNLNLLTLCVESLLKALDLSESEIIIVDNNADGSQISSEWDAVKYCKVISKTSNLMYPNPDKPEKFLQFLQISSTIKKNVGGCVHVTHG